MTITPAKLASLVVAVALVATSLATSRLPSVGLLFALGSLAALALIWVCEPLSEMTGQGAVPVDRRSPAVLVAAFGWLFLGALAVASVAPLFAGGPGR